MKVDRQARIVFACGAPGSGKSHEVKRRLAELQPDRLIVLDPDGEYTECGYLHTQLGDVVKATAFATFRTRFRPSDDRATAEKQFAFLCQLVRWHAAPEPHQARPPKVGPVVLVADELADVTGPSFRDAPEPWRWCVKRGRKYGVTVLAASQRPEEIDKTLFNLCSTLHVHRIGDPVTQARLARSLSVPSIEVQQLLGFAFIELDRNTGELRRAGADGRPARPATARPSPAANQHAPGGPVGSRAARKARKS